jgi:hypothetical protein
MHDDPVAELATLRAEAEHDTLGGSLGAYWARHFLTALGALDKATAYAERKRGGLLEEIERNEAWREVHAIREAELLAERDAALSLLRAAVRNEFTHGRDCQALKGFRPCDCWQAEAKALVREA